MTVASITASSSNLGRLFALLVSLSLSPASFSEEEGEFKIEQEFKPGDPVSAATFNAIFDTIESVNRTVKDDDLIGTWTCRATTGNPELASRSNCKSRGLFVECNDVQLNLLGDPLEATSQIAPYRVETSAPTIIHNHTDDNGRYSGQYQLLNNTLYFSHYRGNAPYKYSVKLESASRFLLSGSGLNNTFDSITCVSTARVPVPPSDLKISQDGVSVSLTWQDNSSDAESFGVFRETTGEGSGLIEIAEVFSNSFTDMNVTEGKSYSYFVVAKNSNGSSAGSIPSAVTVDGVKPSLIAASLGDGEVAARDDRLLFLKFSEPVFLCPPDIVSFDCSPLLGSYLVEGSMRSAPRFPTPLPSDNFGFTLMGSAELFAPNQDIQFTLDKSAVYDANGNQLDTDYILKFRVGEKVNNSQCPPSC